MSDTSDTLPDELISWLQDHDVGDAPKQLMMDTGLNVWGFDLAMESFNRLKPEVVDVMPSVFTYSHENGLLVFVRKS